jgi:hypothetical protein
MSDGLLFLGGCRDFRDVAFRCLLLSCRSHSSSLDRPSSRFSRQLWMQFPSSSAFPLLS